MSIFPKMLLATDGSESSEIAFRTDYSYGAGESCVLAFSVGDVLGPKCSYTIPWHW
jgi:hypothetical protein